MRDIKFRAWDERDSEMISWKKISEWDQDGINSFLDMLTDGRHAVMQYTGLKDKNGKEIYEGDICSGFREDEVVLYEILWMPHCAKFGAKVIKTKYVLSKNLSFPLQHYIKQGTLECTFEVIGNIYKHPHLLKEETT